MTELESDIQEILGQVLTGFPGRSLAQYLKNEGYLDINQLGVEELKPDQWEMTHIRDWKDVNQILEDDFGKQIFDSFTEDNPSYNEVVLRVMFSDWDTDDGDLHSLGAILFDEELEPNPACAAELANTVADDWSIIRFENPFINSVEMRMLVDNESEVVRGVIIAVTDSEIQEYVSDFLFDEEVLFEQVKWKYDL